MSMMKTADQCRNDYAKKKNKILFLLEDAIAFYEKEGMENNAGVFKTLKENLEKGEFSIVVVGEFSAGKSTLLNALMRKRILPSFTNETTATVNFLRHMEKSRSGEAGTVFYHDGRTVDIEELSLDIINKYVSTKGDDVAKTVDHLDLYLDSDFLKDGVTLVDSPGLNGVADGHREITEQQILKSHASIFLFNSDHPGSKTDFDFLHELQKKVKTIFFVLNKIDDIRADEGESVESVIATLKNNYKKQFPEEKSVPEIWPVAAYPALVARNPDPMEYKDIVNRTDEERKSLEEFSRLEDFENRLITFLTCGEKAHQQLLAPVERVIAVAKESRDRFEEEERLLDSATDAGELEGQIVSLKDAVEGLEKQMKESRAGIASRLNDVLRDTVEELSSQMERLQERKLKEIESFDDLDELKDYLKSFESDFTRKVCSQAMNADENLKERIAAVIKMQYMQEADMVEQRINAGDSVINIEVHDHLPPEDIIREYGLKEMDEKVKELELQLEMLQKEEEKAEDDLYQARKKEKKREQLSKEIEGLRESLETVRSQMLPPVDTYVRNVREKEKRGGILGNIVDFCVGQRIVTYQEEVKDPSARDEARTRQEENEKNLNKEIDNKQKELEKYEEVDPFDLERKYNRKREEVQRIRNKLEREQDEQKEVLSKKHDKEIKRCKRLLRDFCDDMTEYLLRQVKKQLRELQDSYVSAAVELVEAAVRGELKDKQQRMRKLQERLQESEENKKSRILDLRAKIERMDSLLSTAAELQVGLENEQVDVIGNVML